MRGGATLNGFRREVLGLPLLLLFSACESVDRPAADTAAFGEESVVDLVAPPDFTRGLVTRNTVTPLFPLQARQLGIEGWAMVSFSVDANGDVIGDSITLVDSDPVGYFERTALNAARLIAFDNIFDHTVDDIRYVFRFELEEDGRVPSVSTEPRFRELIPRRYITPAYPEAARNAGITGYATVAFTVTSRGTVADVRIVESEPPGVFDAVAVEAARRLIFEPRIVGDEPVAVEDVRYRFEWP